MLRMGISSLFVRDTAILKDMMPMHRSGAAVFMCNYSTGNRVVHFDWSQDLVTWHEMLVTTRAGSNPTGVLVVPYGIVIGQMFPPANNNIDVIHVRIDLDARADGEGVFVQFETAAPIPDYPLL